LETKGNKLLGGDDLDIFHLKKPHHPKFSFNNVIPNPYAPIRNPSSKAQHRPMKTRLHILPPHHAITDPPACFIHLAGTLHRSIPVFVPVVFPSSSKPLLGTRNQRGQVRNVSSCSFPLCLWYCSRSSSILYK
jgi:hypothetical protein